MGAHVCVVVGGVVVVLDLNALRFAATRIMLLRNGQKKASIKTAGLCVSECDSFSCQVSAQGEGDLANKSRRR